MDTNANSGASGATDTSSVTAIKVQVVLDTTTEQLKKQFSGIQTDIEKDPIGLTFGVDKKTSKDAIIKGLQEILGKGTNITIGAGVDPNAGSQVKKQVQNVANAGQQAANKNKVKIKVQTDVDDGTKNKLDAYYKRLKERYDLEAKIASSTVNGVINPELDGAGKRLKAVRAELKQLKSELQGKIPTDKYSKAYEIWHSGQARIAAAGQSASGTLNRREDTKNTTLTKREVQEKLNEFYTQQKKAGALEQASLTLGNKTANSKELEAVKTQLEKAQESAKNLRTELSNLLPDEEIDKLTKFDNELDDNLIRIKGRIADQNAAKTKSESDAQLNAAKKAKISEYNSELSNFKKLTLDSARLEGKSNSENELSFVNQQMEDSLNNLNKLQTDLGDVLSKNELDEIIRQYEKFESDLADEVTRIEAHYEDLKNARESTKATAEEKRQAKQTDDYTNDLATARNKYKNMSGVPSDVSDSLDNVDAQIKKLDTLKVGTQDYTEQLKVIGTAWTDATRQMDAFDDAQKKTENRVKSMTEQALKWKESIKDSETASQELRDSIDGIISASKKLDSDHSSETYKQGVKDLDDAFISTKASMSVYTDGYKNLESTATKTLTEIRKKQLELQQAGNHKFDNVLTGDSKSASLDGSLESQFNYLKRYNSQSADYKQILEGIVEEWKKIKIEIDQALKSEEDLEKEADKRKKKLDDLADSIQSIENQSRGAGNTLNTELKKYVYGEKWQKDGDQQDGILNGLREKLNTLSGTTDVSEYKRLLQELEAEIDTAGQKVTDFKKRFQESGAYERERKNLNNLVLQIDKYTASLSGLDKRKDLAEELNSIRQAAVNGTSTYSTLSNLLSNLQIRMEQAGISAETLGQKLSRLFKEHFQTAIAMAGVAMVKQGLREVYDNVLELDTAVTELKKVSKMTGDEMNEYLDRTATNARELGANISDLVSSTADWKRLGYTDKDSEELARVSALMANVGDQIDNATTASSYLISAMQGFGLVADDAERLLDCMNQIANTEPVSMNDLGIIMQKSSAAMSAAGNTYQETLSLAAAVNGVLQDADTSGTYLKTLSMYLRASKTDAENAGIATDGMADSVSELRSELKQLAGVDIMKDNNTFKSTYQIMKELSEVWKDLSDTTQANITELISGKRGGQSTSALLNNFSVAEDAMKQALNSSGSAMRENQTYMDSLQAKLNQLDSAFQKFSTDLMKSDIPKFFVSLATVFVDGADSAVKFAGALPTLTAAISGVLSVMQMSGKLKNGAGKVNMPSYICCV
nr:MAG TPA: minor tail protein [Caudoviricetes sp.]